MIIVALMQYSRFPVYIPIYTQETLAPVVVRSMYHSIIKKCWAKWFESVNQYLFTPKRVDEAYNQHEYKFVHNYHTAVFIPKLFGVSESEDSRPVLNVLSRGMWQVLGANALAATIPGMLLYLRNQYHDREVKPIIPGGFLADFYLGVGGGEHDPDNTPTPGWLSFIDEYLTMYDNWPMAPVLHPVQVISNSVKAQALWLLFPEFDTAYIYNYLPRVGGYEKTGSLGSCLYEKYADKAANVAYKWYLTNSYELN